MEKSWDFVVEDAQIVWNGGCLQLSPHEAIAFGMLDKAFPHHVNRQTLMIGFYPYNMADADLPDDPSGVVDVTISHLRRKLEEAKAPFHIPRGRHVGYRIATEQDQTGILG